jgi:hypothetical protein
MASRRWALWFKLVWGDVWGLKDASLDLSTRRARNSFDFIGSVHHDAIIGCKTMHDL